MATRFTLKVVSGELRGQEFTFAASARCVLGRSRSCGLRLPFDPSVSRQHCLIEGDDDGVWAQDLCSLNGTYVNGERIGTGVTRNGEATVVEGPRMLLRDGDELRICGNVFQVQLSDADGTRPQDGSRHDWTLAMSG